MKRVICWFSFLAFFGSIYGPATASTLNCAIFAFDGGTSIINSATSIVGDVCYNQNVTSDSNQKAENFDGTVRVHSQVTSFSYTEKNFLPSGGILTSGQDAALEAEEAALLAQSQALGALADNASLNDDGSGNLSVAADPSGTTVVSLTGLDLNGESFTLDGASTYIFNFSDGDPNSVGMFEWAHSQLLFTNGASPEDVTWNFLDPFDIKINKDDVAFGGLILAPTSDVEYHNPATFDGQIAALNINLHSDFNLTSTMMPIPVPAAGWLLLAAFGVLSLIGRHRA